MSVELPISGLLADLLAAGLLRTARVFAEEVGFGLPLVNAVMRWSRSHAPDLWRSEAGLVARAVREGVRAGIELELVDRGVTISDALLPVQPNLFPSGRMGDRYEYRTTVWYRVGVPGEPEAELQPITIYIRSEMQLTRGELEARAQEQALDIVTRSQTQRDRHYPQGEYVFIRTTIDFMERAF